MSVCKCTPVLICLNPCSLLLRFSDFIKNSIYKAAIKMVTSNYTFSNQLFFFLFLLYWVTIHCV